MPIACCDCDTDSCKRTQIGEELDHASAWSEGLRVAGMGVAESPQIFIADALFQPGAWLHVCRTDGSFSNRLRRDFRQRIEEFLGGIETEDGFDSPVEGFPVVGFSTDQRAVHIKDNQHEDCILIGIGTEGNKENEVASLCSHPLLRCWCV